jgi:hypothetical protein
MNPVDPRCSLGPPLSPCIRICQMEANGWCRGCQRTLAEISDWWSLRDDQKRAILADLPRRRASTESRSAPR